LAWSLIALGLFVVSTQADWPPFWQGFLLAIPLMIATVGWGWRGSVALVPIGIALVWGVYALSGENHPASFYAGLLPLFLLGLGGGQAVYQLWRRSERRARTHAKRTELLANTVLSLQRARTPKEVYDALPLLLADVLHFTHAEVFVPEGSALKLVASHRWTIPKGFELSFDSITGRAYTSGKWQLVADTRTDPDYVKAPNAPASGTELAIPLYLNGNVVAVLNIEHQTYDAFDHEDLKVLKAFTELAEASLLRSYMHGELEREVRERTFSSHVSHRLSQLEHASAMAAYMLRELTTLFAYEGGTVLRLIKGRFYPLAIYDEPLPETVQTKVRKQLQLGLPWDRGQLHECWRLKHAIFIRDYQVLAPAEAPYAAFGLRAVAFVPITTRTDEIQAILMLATFSHPREWSEEERRLLANAADILGLALERAEAQRQLQGLLDVMRQLTHTDDPVTLYQGTVEAAAKLIPDCEGASLLVRTERGFTFSGAIGFDVHELRQLPPLTHAKQLEWYGRDEGAFRQGIPRILRHSEIQKRTMGAISDEKARAVIERVGKVSQIRSNICVPITYQREVLGVLNLDSFSREDAFSQRDLQLAEAFAQQIATTIRQVLYRQALERNVVTDPLTHLGNRAGFNRQLKEELASAQRHDYPLSLIMMDLDGFKKINDTFGHQAGDEALVEVAEALRRERRQGDGLYRWGGDEFAVILPRTDATGAALAAARYLKAIHDTTVHGISLGASIGIASYPADGKDSESLLKKADDLMYAHKHGDTPATP
jgi:diguanylate cyclase (GGDEF)-like protein